MFMIFNGPPGSGKDHACEYVKKTHGAHHVSFKTELFLDVKEFYRISDANWVDFLLHYNDRGVKEEPVDYLNGDTRRQAMIHVSENVIKPQFGYDYYGRCVANSLECHNYVASDGGFVEEIQPIVDNYNYGSVVIVQLFRRSCDFSNDSRRYISGNVISTTPMHTTFILDRPDQFTKDKVDVDIWPLDNNGTVEEFEKNISSIFSSVKNKDDRSHKTFDVNI